MEQRHGVRADRHGARAARAVGQQPRSVPGNATVPFVTKALFCRSRPRTRPHADA